MEFLVSLALYGLLVAAGAVPAVAFRARDTRTRIALVGILSLVVPLGAFFYLPITTRADFLHAFPLVAIVPVGSLLLASIVFLAWISRILAVLPLVGLLVLIVLVASGGRLPGPTYGWGLIAIPPFLAGLLLATIAPLRRTNHAVMLLAGVVALAAVAAPWYVQQMEWQRYEASYALSRQFRGELSAGAVARIVATTHQRELLYTMLYLAGALLLLTLPLLSLPPRRRRDGLR